jgi:hypothetical protein
MSLSRVIATADQDTLNKVFDTIACEVLAKSGQQRPKDGGYLPGSRKHFDCCHSKADARFARRWSVKREAERVAGIVPTEICHDAGDISEDISHRTNRFARETVCRWTVNDGQR